jgi:hypothetical protein
MLMPWIWMSINDEDAQREALINLHKELIGINVWLTRALPCNQIPGSMFLGSMLCVVFDLTADNS